MDLQHYHLQWSLVIIGLFHGDDTALHCAAYEGHPEAVKLHWYS